MKREKHILCIYLPQWSIDTVRRKQQLKQAILLFDKKRAEQIVVRRCRLCAGKGVNLGMSIAHARALVPNAHVQAFEQNSELSTLRSIGRWASRFSPLVQIETPDFKLARISSELHYGISIDISGSARLFGGLATLLKTIESSLRRFGINHRLAVAPSLGAAWALSRFAQEQVVLTSSHKLIPAVSNLPVEALRLPEQSCQALAELGVKNISELLALPSKQLSSRFGPQLPKRLAQLLGALDEPINPIKTKHVPYVSIDFSSPSTEISSVLLASKKAFCELVDSIQSSGKAARHFSVNFKRYKAADVSKELSLHFPSNNSEHLWWLIKPRLENLNLGDGVERVTVSAKRQARYEPTLAAMWKEFAKEGSSPQHIGELIDTLMAQLGEESIVVHHQMLSHLPEKSLSFTPASIDNLENPRAEQRALPNRPSKFFKTPEKISALSMLPDKPPHQIQWNRQALNISLGIGPERIAPEWWNRRDKVRHPNSRDYFTLQADDGTWLWVFRDIKTSHWYLQGIYA